MMAYCPLIQLTNIIKMSVKKYILSIYKTVFIFFVIIYTSQTYAIANEDSRNSAECSVRAMIIQYSIEAYYGQYYDVKFSSQ